MSVSSCLLNQARDCAFRVLLDLPQTIFAAEAIRIDLVDFFGSGWPCGKPPALGNHFDAAEKSAAAWSGRNLRADRLAGKC